MTWTRLLPQTQHLCLLALSFIFTSYPTSAVQTDQSVSYNSDTAEIRFLWKADGASRGRPRRSGGTGTRGDCLAKEIPLTPLVPTSNLGLTVNEQPTFWFYAPYQAREILSGEFSLQDEQNNDIYRTLFTLAGTPGIVSIALPPQVALKTDQSYRWYFKIYCPSQESPSPAFVQGWVRRVSPDDISPEFKNQLNTRKTLMERVALYAENGIWHETITALAELKRTSPPNAGLDADWANLLRAVGLQELLPKPILGSVRTNSPREGKVPSNTGFRNSHNGS